MSSQDQNSANQTVSPILDDRNATHDILTTAMADGRFSALLAAVQGAKLEGVLQDPELVTVFAPLKGVIEGKDIRHHVMRGAVTDADLRTTNQVKMSDGATLPIERDGANLKIGGIQIVESDISCTNGVLHVIDSVLTSS